MQIKRENYEKLWGKNRGIIGKQIDYKLYVMSQQKKSHNWVDFKAEGAALASTLLRKQRT